MMKIINISTKANVVSTPSEIAAAKVFFSRFLFFAPKHIAVISENPSVRPFRNPVLNLLHVPQAQFEMAYAYISVLIVGLFATLFYNLCANTLRAIGDALTPLIFLILATVSSENPSVRPFRNPVINVCNVDTEPTAANASVPSVLPTIFVSTRLYNS